LPAPIWAGTYASTHLTMAGLIASPGSATKASAVPPEPVKGATAAASLAWKSSTSGLTLDQQTGGPVTGEPPVRVGDLDGPVGQRGHIGLRQRLFHSQVDLGEVRGARVPLQRRDVRLVGVVKRPPLRQALEHSRVDRAGTFHRGLVRLYQHVDRRQVAHRTAPSGKTVFQSFFMLTTVRLRSFASARDFSAPLV
jgi:hypothetical protein